MTRGALLAGGLAVVFGAAGCQTTQDKSAELAKKAIKLKLQKGVQVTRVNRDVAVTGTTLLQDANGVAAVVELRNRSRKPLDRLPIAISVLGPGGKALAANSAPGIDTALVRTPALGPGGSEAWIDDQIQLRGALTKVKAKVGLAAGAAPPAKRPKLVASKPKLHNDPLSGVAVVGTVLNASTVDQRQLVIYAVARRGGRIVAAGRGQIPRLKPGDRRKYTVFFIGNPKGAQVSVSVPPTQFK